ncbi:MAG TPA: hypothetical protein EYG86_09450 [Crocinitomicaceae bacterium]|nr:hypothetical protein [Crocinitomicaceae bacterium]
MKTLFYCLLILALLSSCNGGVEDIKNINLPDNIGEITHYEILFDENQFISEDHLAILKELNICDTIEIEESNCSLCSPEHFKILPLRKDKDLKDAFLLQIKALTVLKGQEAKLPVRHLIVFEREKGGLVKVNGFRGKLIASRISANGVDDLVVRFYIPEEEAFFNCLFEWNGAKYRFKSVEAIDGNGGQGSVKESLKVELSKDVYQLLMNNNMLF